MNPFDLLFSAQILASVTRSLIPLLLLGIGGVICYQAGIFNVALEGLLLLGAFAAVAGSALSGSVWVGVLAAVATCSALSIAFGTGAIYRGGDPLVIGTAMNLLVAALTAFALQAIFGVRGTYQSPGLDRLPHWFAAAEHRVPWIGPALASLSPLGIVALFAVPVTAVLLYRTVAGLRLRGAGARPHAAISLGVTPSRYQFLALIVAGIAGGLAGSELSLGSVALFTENMSAGRGWVIVLMLLLTNGRIHYLLAALLVYAYAEALGFRLQTIGLPMQFSDAAPYLATLAVMVWVCLRRRRRGAGAAWGQLGP